MLQVTKTLYLLLLLLRLLGSCARASTTVGEEASEYSISSTSPEQQQLIITDERRSCTLFLIDFTTGRLRQMTELLSFRKILSMPVMSIRLENNISMTHNNNNQTTENDFFLQRVRTFE